MTPTTTTADTKVRVRLCARSTADRDTMVLALVLRGVIGVESLDTTGGPQVEMTVEPLLVGEVLALPAQLGIDADVQISVN